MLHLKDNPESLIQRQQACKVGTLTTDTAVALEKQAEEYQKRTQRLKEARVVIKRPNYVTIGVQR